MLNTSVVIYGTFDDLSRCELMGLVAWCATETCWGSDDCAFALERVMKGDFEICERGRVLEVCGIDRDSTLVLSLGSSSMKASATLPGREDGSDAVVLDMGTLRRMDLVR